MNSKTADTVLKTISHCLIFPDDPAKEIFAFPNFSNKKQKERSNAAWPPQFVKGVRRRLE
jgi:hypothetical protein